MLVKMGMSSMMSMMKRREDVLVFRLLLDSSMFVIMESLTVLCILIRIRRVCVEEKRLEWSIDTTLLDMRSL